MTQSKTRVVRSMTGQGHATAQGELGTVVVELRTVNNRGFKCAPRLSDSLSSLENKVETLVRSGIHRGTVHIAVSLRRPPGESRPNIDSAALQSYLQELRELRSANEDLVGEIDLSSLLTLPGVISSSREDRRNDQELWAFVAGAISTAIENLDQMRAVEGQRMADTLSADRQQIEQRLSKVEQIAPRAVDVYRERMQAKIERILKDHGLEAPAVDLLRELQVYADRVDVSEEIVRLGSHLSMFESVLQGGEQPEPTGRKLDFILQEMFRETNTIGSKAADSELSAQVVEIKCAIERMRELVQNLE